MTDANDEMTQSDIDTIADDGMTPSDVDTMYSRLVDAICRHKLVPFVGAGANRAGRPEEFAWEGPPKPPGHEDASAEAGVYAPDGGELSRFLAGFVSDPQLVDVKDLAKIAQAFVEEKEEEMELHNLLGDALQFDYTPTTVHRFLASLPERFRQAGLSPAPYPLIITTNYDDVLERAFDAVGEEYDTMVYDPPSGDMRPNYAFVHYPYNSEPRPARPASKYIKQIRLEERTLIVKIHGAVHRMDAENRPAKNRPTEGSYVITEDDYIDFLGLGQVSEFMPMGIHRHLVHGNGKRFLFLGYSLRDWNLRVVLRRVLTEAKVKAVSYAIQLEFTKLESLMWKHQLVTIHKAKLAEFIGRLEDGLERKLEERGGH